MPTFWKKTLTYVAKRSSCLFENDKNISMMSFRDLEILFSDMYVGFAGFS